MLFKDYFELGKDKEKEAKELHEQALNLYAIYFNYIKDKMDNYNKEANISVLIKGYNYFNNRYNDFGSVELYGPYVFNHACITLIYQPLNRKMVQIWNNHVFIDGVEKGEFKFNYKKTILENYSQFLEKQTVDKIKTLDYENLKSYII